MKKTICKRCDAGGRIAVLVDGKPGMQPCPVCKGAGTVKSGGAGK